MLKLVITELETTLSKFQRRNSQTFYTERFYSILREDLWNREQYFHKDRGSNTATYKLGSERLHAALQLPGAP